MQFSKNMLLVMSCLSLVIFASACGSDKNTTTVGVADTGVTLPTGNGSVNYVYAVDETINGDHCVFQSPNYTSLTAYCNALESQNANRDPQTGEACGEDIRQGLFEDNCPGTFADTP